MASIIFENADGRRLVGGLDWRLLPATGSMAARVRDGASASGAKHATIATATSPEEISFKGKRKLVNRVSAGFFSTIEGTKPGKGTHSLAAAFALWAREHPAALLNVKTTDGHFAVVVVINGLPVLDRLEADGASAYNKALPFLQERDDISVFSDDSEKYPRSLKTEGLLEAIAAAAAKSTALASLPVDVARMSIVALVVLGVAAGTVHHMKTKAEKTRKAALERQRANDPLPKYLNALAAARESAGVQRSALQAGFSAAQALPVTPEGWRVTRIGCTAVNGCEVTFFRSTGTLESLRAAMPRLELVPVTGINLNEARMTWKHELPLERLESSLELSSLGTFLQGKEASKLQTWLVAGPSVQLAPPQLWPQVPGVPQSFIHPSAIRAGKFEVTAVALPQVLEVLATAPSNVSWSGWSVEIGDAKQEPLSRAKARLTGTYYVKQN